jgi:hypothetical protein
LDLAVHDFSKLSILIMYALLLLDDVEMQEEAPDLDDVEMQEDDEEMGQETTDSDLGMFSSLKLNFSCVWVAEFF